MSLTARKQRAPSASGSLEFCFARNRPHRYQMGERGKFVIDARAEHALGALDVAGGVAHFCSIFSTGMANSQELKGRVRPCETP